MNRRSLLTGAAACALFPAAALGAQCPDGRHTWVVAHKGLRTTFWRCITCGIVTQTGGERPPG